MNQKEKQKKAMINIVRKKGKEMRKMREKQQKAFTDKELRRIKGEDKKKISPSSKHPAKAFNR